MAVGPRRLIAASALGLVVLSGCGANQQGDASATSSPVAASIAGGSATLGALRISGAYIPAPASPSVAAAYFTVTNSGSTPDRLVAISSPAFGSAHLMSNRTTADGGDIMVMLRRPALIPADGSLSLQTGGLHTMLEQPKEQLREGQSVRLTLQFAKAGQVSLVVPVVAMTGLPMTSMSSMPGMSMPSS